MIIFKGQGVSDGYAIGTLTFLKENFQSENLNNYFEQSAEIQKFSEAQKIAVKELCVLSEKLKNEGKGAASLIIEAQAVMAEDPDFSDMTVSIIQDENISAASAVLEAGKSFAKIFNDMQSSEMQERSADILDVSKRIARIISNQNTEASFKGNIFASKELLPSDAARLGNAKAAAFITGKNDTLGHNAIIARAYGIPMVTGLEDILNESNEGKTVIVDGFEGTVFLEPDEQTAEKYNKLMKQISEETEALKKYIDLKAVSKSGKQIKLCCNIESLEEIENVKQNGADGIGLFRSEFIFLNRNSEPSESEQFDIYKKVLSEMEGKEVIIRTMDIGADKELPYLGIKQESNPALALRGLRFSLEHEQLFRTQLRALYRASVYGKLSIMFPMVTDTSELKSAEKICKSVMQELKNEGIKTSDVPIGIMIETPASALLSDELAKEADFFSIGTNDLTQYTLCAGRNESGMAKYSSAMHPAVLKLIKIAANNAHKNGIKIGICGELASDEAATELLLDIGIDELSVSPQSLLKIKKHIIG